MKRARLPLVGQLGNSTKKAHTKFEWFQQHFEKEESKVENEKLFSQTLNLSSSLQPKHFCKNTNWPSLLLNRFYLEPRRTEIFDDFSIELKQSSTQSLSLVVNIGFSVDKYFAEIE